MNDQELTHIDLFSGIGGFTLAGEWAGFRTVVFCEKEPFCQEVLKKHWPTVPIIPDIRDFDGTKWRGATLLTGGFPCQPFSQAGKRKGKEDDRYLWPEMLRIISEARPNWIIAENVTGFINMELSKCKSDLEAQNYQAEPFVIPACAINAPHRRNRIWLIAVSAVQRKISVSQQRQRNGSEQENKTFKDSSSKRLEGGIDGQKRLKKKGMRLFSTRPNFDASDSSIQRLERICKKKFKKPFFHAQRRSWETNWYEVATSLCRVDDGIPSWVHGNRVKRLKALGNAIVPQIAYEIIKRIAWIENERAAD